MAMVRALILLFVPGDRVQLHRWGALAASLVPASNGLGVYYLFGDETTEDEGPNMQQVPERGQHAFLQLCATMGRAYSLHTPLALPTALRRGRNVPTRLRRAMTHSLLGGGKRLRPILCLAAAEACGGPARRALPLAAAVEWLHQGSLVLDDIIDEATTRRGQPCRRTSACSLPGRS